MGLKVQYVRIVRHAWKVWKSCPINHLIPTQASWSTEVSGAHSLWAPKLYPDFQIQISSINIISGRHDWSNISSFINYIWCASSCCCTVREFLCEQLLTFHLVQSSSDFHHIHTQLQCTNPAGQISVVYLHLGWKCLEGLSFQKCGHVVTQWTQGVADFSATKPHV